MRITATLIMSSIFPSGAFLFICFKVKKSCATISTAINMQIQISIRVLLFGLFLIIADKLFFSIVSHKIVDKGINYIEEKYLMKKMVLVLLLYFLGCLLIPCLVTLAIGDREKAPHKEEVFESHEVSNPLEAEDYVIRTVASYYEDGDSKEFLKALAIVVRTYNACGRQGEITVESLTYQELKSKWGDYYPANYEAVLAAVKETEGVVLQCDEGEVLPYFCKISAGYTRSRENSCLAMVNCSEDLQAPDYMSVVTMGFSTVAEKIKKEYPDFKYEGNISESFQIISRDESGYVSELMVGNLILSGDELSEVLELNSGNFMVTTGEDKMIFTVKGVGKGYGMSLYSARKKALGGAGYKEILFYFYKNIILSE